MSVPRVALVALVALSATAVGCHGKLKRAAPHIDAVRVEAHVAGGPMVSLGRVSGAAATEEATDDLAEAIINTVQVSREIAHTNRVAQAVDPTLLADEVGWGVMDTLDGAPFGVTHEESHDDVLRLQILSYGIESGQMGAPAAFTVTTRALLTMDRTERVYRKTMTCAVPLGEPDPVAAALNVVNNHQAIKQLTDAEIEDALRRTARACGEQLVWKLQRHAS